MKYNYLLQVKKTRLFPNNLYHFQKFTENTYYNCPCRKEKNSKSKLIKSYLKSIMS